MSEEKIKEKMKAMIDSAPRTVSEVQEKIGDKFGLSRSQVDYRLTTMAMKGEVKFKKPKPKASKIFFRKDYGEGKDEEASRNNY